MALLATQFMANTGLSPTYAAAAGGGDTFVPADGAFLHVINAGGAPITATLATPQVIDGDLAVADRAITVTNATNKMIPIPPGLYRDPATGLGSVTYSGVTSVTVAVISR